MLRYIMIINDYVGLPNFREEVRHAFLLTIHNNKPASLRRCYGAESMAVPAVILFRPVAERQIPIQAT